MINFKPISLPIAGGYFHQDGIIHIPTTNPLPSGKWPLIVFWHGFFVYTVTDLLNQGLPLALERAGEVSGTVTLVAASGNMSATAAKVNFAVIAILGQGGYPLDNQFTNDVIKLAESQMPGKIDYNYVTATGLSGGGGLCIVACQDPNTSAQFSTMIPMSPNGIPHSAADVQQIVNNKIKTMVFVGANDVPDYVSNAKNLNLLLNSVQPNSSTINIVPTAHDLWDKNYDPLAPYKIYDFMLANPKAGTVQPAPNPVPTPTKKLLHTITTKFYDDNSTETIVT